MEPHDFKQIDFKPNMEFQTTDGKWRILRGVDFETGEFFDNDNTNFVMSSVKNLRVKINPICKHEWVDIENEKIAGVKLCIKCKQAKKTES